MAHSCNNQGWPSDEGSLHMERESPISPRLESIRSFLDLNSPKDSASSLPIHDSAYADLYGASFLLLSSAPSIATADTMTNTVSHVDMKGIEKMDSSIANQDANQTERGSPLPSCASIPVSGTTTTTCSSSRSSVISQRRASLFAGVLRQVSRLRQPESIDENFDHVDSCQLSPRRHGQHQDAITLLGRNKSEPTRRPPPRSQSQRTDHCDSPVQSASKAWRSSLDRRCTSSDGVSPTLSITRGEFEALPLTIKRKVSPRVE